MKHKGTQTIETQRLILRKFSMSDIESAYKNWASDVKITEYLNWKAHKDVLETEEKINKWILKSINKEYYKWAIIYKETGDNIGELHATKRDDGIDIMRVGYSIGSKWWYKGIAAEALSGIIEFMFKEMDVNRIEARHDVNNCNSGNVMRKCGMVCEGTLRQASKSNRGIIDVCIHSILKSDWEKDKNKNRKIGE